MDKINIYVLFAVTLVSALGGGILRTWLSKRRTDSSTDFHIYNIILSLSAGTIIILLNINSLKISWFTTLLAVLFGVVTALGSVLSSTALSCGPWTYTEMFSTLSTIIPTVSGVLIWHEPSISVGQWIGIAAMIACFVLSTGKSRGGKNANLRWLLICIALFFCIGCIGVMQKWHQSSSHREELGMFLAIAFLCSAVFSFLNVIIRRKKVPSKIKWKLPMISLAALAGLSAALCNQINLYLSGVVKTVVFFPVVNGGGLILITLASVVVFKERLSIKQWCGLALGAVALTFICQIVVI